MNAVLFDFGGTIDTDGVHWSEKYWELYGRFNIETAKQEFEKAFVESERLLNADRQVAQMTFYETLRKQLNLQFGILGLAGKRPVVPAMLDACYADVRRTILAATGVLGRLQAKYRLGIVSNFYGNLEIVCKEFDLFRFFDAIIDSAVVGI